jgi:hypothetical protein
MEEKFETETRVKLAEHGKEIGSVKHRVKGLEEQQKSIHELAISVKELVLNMQYMLEEQKEQGKRLELLEQEPSRQYKQLKTIIITALTTTIVGSIVGAILMLI